MGAYSTVPFQTKTLTWGTKCSCGNRARKNRDLNKKEVVEKKKNRGRLERRSRGRRKDRERWGNTVRMGGQGWGNWRSKGRKRG